MKIVHCCFACFYIDNYAYQENILPMLNMQQGHDVLVLASTESFIDGKTAYVDAASYTSEHGFSVVRLPYAKFGLDAVTKKMKLCRRIVKHLEAFKPDVIFLHGLCSLSTLEVIKYKKKHPAVCVLSDTHATAKNSGRNWVSLHILHRIIWRRVIQSSLPYIDKVLCISDECLQYAQENFKIPNAMLEWYPLGSVCIPEDQYAKMREKKRRELGIKENQILFTHTGKMDKLKRTIEILRAFSKVNADDILLIIGGVFLSDIKEEAEKLIASDLRVRYIGWLNQEQMTELLCATDVYVQPGSASVTMQNAMGHACALMLYPHYSYERFIQNNGCFVKTQEDIERAIEKMAADRAGVSQMQWNSYQYARKHLEYAVLAHHIDELYYEYQGQRA